MVTGFLNSVVTVRTSESSRAPTYDAGRNPYQSARPEPPKRDWLAVVQGSPAQNRIARTAKSPWLRLARRILRFSAANEDKFPIHEYVAVAFSKLIDPLEMIVRLNM